MAGVGRGKLMPVGKFLASPDIALPISVVFQTISGEYPNYTGLIDILEVDFDLPRSLLYVVSELEAATAQHDVLGEPFVRTYAAIKEAETFMGVISGLGARVPPPHV